LVSACAPVAGLLSTHLACGVLAGGYYVNPDNAPRVFRWIPKVSLIKWAFEGMSVNEFRGLTFDASEPGDQATGEGVLKRLGFGGSSING
jgi:hypothetical protein